MSVPPASLFIEGGKIMGFLNWIFGTSNEEARRLIALEVKKQQELRQISVPVDEMDQGDYHSGPEGYSPNTAYPETQYGSGFDEDADWNEEH
jgi:hypothetical protein